MTGIPHSHRKKCRYGGQSARMTKPRKSDSYHHEGITNPERIPSLRTAGIWMVWLWTAITTAGASHTAHLVRKAEGTQSTEWSTPGLAARLLWKPSCYKSHQGSTVLRKRNVLWGLLLHKPSLPIYIIKLQMKPVRFLFFFKKLQNHGYDILIFYPALNLYSYLQQSVS